MFTSEEISTIYANFHQSFSINKTRFYVKYISVIMWILLILLSFYVIESTSAIAQSSATGTLGWCAAIGQNDECTYEGSASSACQTAMAAFNPDATYMGAEIGDNWNVAGCKWCKYNADGIGCFGIAAPTVTFYCASGYHSVPPGNCVKDGDPDFQPRSCSESGGKTTPRTGNPVVLLTGSKYFQHVDFASAYSTLDLSRIYSNKRAAGQSYSPTVGFGSNWLYDFQLQIALPGYFWTYSKFSLMFPDGSAVDFKRGDDGSVAATGDSGTPGGYSPDYTLRFLDTWPSNLGDVPSIKTHWELKDPAGTTWIFETFNSNYSVGGNGSYQIGRPISRTKLSGEKTLFSYDEHGKLLSMIDTFGNKIIFDWYNNAIADPNTSSSTYNKPAAIKSAKLPDGSIINYTYADQAGSGFKAFDFLSKAERLDKDGKIVNSLSYNAEDARFPSYITSVVDGRGIKINKVTYDDRGRVTNSSLANGMDSSSILYSDINSDGTITRTVTNALGKQAVYTYVRKFNNFLFKSKDGLASANCAEGISSQIFDDNGFVVYTIDEEGRKTAYTRDSIGRPVTITRGAPQ